MKGLQRIPKMRDLLEAYNALQGSQPLALKRLVLYTQWIRFDPRLGELISDYLFVNWEEMHPLHLRRENLTQPWPQVLGVLLDHVALRFGRRTESLALFKAWSKSVMSGVRPAHGELFYFGIYTLRSPLTRELPTISERPFLRWGYYEREPLLKKGDRVALPKKERLRRLRELISNQKTFSVSDYLQALGHNISRRQAERDLNECEYLKPKGFTRGRVYKVSFDKL